MSLHVFGESFKDELAVRGGRQLENPRHPLYQRKANHAPLRVSNQQAFNRFMQQCYEEAERKLRAEDAREREVAAREGRPYRTREERERLKKEKEEKEKREKEERRKRGESDGGGFRMRTFDASVSYYATLGVDESASSKEIKRAYKKLALRYHPDKMAGKTAEEVAEAEMIFKQAMEAYEILADEDTRENYDKARDQRKYGKNSPMNDPDFAEKVARRREQARREREVRMNTKEERIEVIVPVTMAELSAGCTKEVSFQRRYFERNETGIFTKYREVTKVLEIRKGWNPAEPLVLESEGHASKEYQTGDVFCLVQEQEHQQFERSGAKDLSLKAHLCPKYESGAILEVVAVEALDGSRRVVVTSYLPLLLSGGGERREKMEQLGMPDPKAPFFDPPGDLYITVSVPAGNYHFQLAQGFAFPRKVYLSGSEESRARTALAAIRICADHPETLARGARTGVCICCKTQASRGAEAFMETVKHVVGGFEWLTIHVGGDQVAGSSYPPLLDEEVIGLENAEILVLDPGRQPVSVMHLMAPIDGSEVASNAQVPGEGDVEVPETLAMSCGLGSYGQLALGDRETQCRTLRKMRVRPGEVVEAQPVGVSAGETHSAVLLSDGEVLTCGMGNFGQTGRPESSSTFELAPVVWDVFSQKPKVMAVACGSRHTLLIDEVGSVWSFGCSRFGQLGHGDTYDINEPQRVWPEEGLPRTVSPLRAVQVSAGGSHSLMLDTKGQCWAWGHNEKGELGVRDFETRLSPVRVGFPSAALSLVCAGTANSAFLTVDGEVFTCGSHTSGLLGYPSSQDVATPRKVENLGARVIKVCLQEHMAAWCDSMGRINLWGAALRQESPRIRQQVFKVVHKKVVVRTAPSTSSPMAGVKYSGDVVKAEKEQNGWIKLSPESHPQGSLARGNSFWMLIDGSHLNLGLLLENVTNEMDPQGKESLGTIPYCAPYDKFVKDVVCCGSNVIACCESGKIWKISAEEVVRSKNDGRIIIAEEVGCLDSMRVSSSGLSASSSHIMIVAEQAAELANGDDDLEIPDTILIDPEETLENMVALFQHHELFEALWMAHLRGAIVVGLGEAAALLGVTAGVCNGSSPHIRSLLPHVVRRCDAVAQTGIERLRRALKALSPYFSKSLKPPYNDISGASFAKDSVLAWDPMNPKEVDEVLPMPEGSEQALREASKNYLANLCLSEGEVGGGDLSRMWSHRMGLQAITEATAAARDRQKLREQREANLKLIRDEEIKVMGEVPQTEQRSDFDVFGCQRGGCENCKDCKAYQQPFHMGLASGSYAFLCASCGCSHSKHAEVVH